MSAENGSNRPLIGRDRERTELADLVREVITGRGGALVLHGRLGSGRSRLLADALPDSTPATIVRIVGVATESPLPGAALHRLVHALGVELPELPGPLGFEQSCGRRPRDRLALSVAVHDLLIRTGREHPLICVVDDADQVDRLSLEVLGFAGRRLAAEPVLLLVATTWPAPNAEPRAPKTGDDPLAGLPSLLLAPLGEADSRRLLAGVLSHDDPAELAELPDDVLAALSHQAQGNPLALVELAGSLTAGQLHGIEPLPIGLPLGSQLRRHHQDLLAPLAGPARRVVLIAAAQQPLDLDALLRAVLRTGSGPSAVDAAVAAGVLRIEGGRVVIPDRLLQATSYADASLTERLDTHRLLAEVLDHDTHRLDQAWHRAMSMAAQAPDGSAELEQLADQLEELATWAVRAGDQTGASRCLERSAALTSVPGRAGERLVAAARAAWLDGDVRRARLLLGQARPLAATAELQAVVDLLLGEIELRSGSAESAYDALNTVADGLAGPRQAEAVIALLRASEMYMLAGDHPRFLSAARRIGQLPHGNELPQTQLMFEQFAGFSATFLGDHRRAAGPLHAVVELGPHSHDPSALILATMAAMTLGDEIRSHSLARRAVQLARAKPGSAHLPVALEFLAFTEFWRDRFPASATHAREGLELAAQAGQDNSVAAHLAILALLSTLHGDSDDALVRAQVATRQADGRGLGRPRSLTIWAAARMALATGRGDGAVAALRAVAIPSSARSGMHLTIKVMATPDLIEAAVKYGDQKWVPPALATFESWASETAGPAMLALAARCHALTSADDDADEYFREALRLHGERDLEFERARTQLLYGRALRRRRRPARAREHLHDALEVFDALDARGWAGQARAELRAAGGVSGPSTTARALTPQQTEIARLVAGGATNREIAAQLFLSPRTVDHHLRNIFVRLGVRSRVELARLVS